MSEKDKYTIEEKLASLIEGMIMGLVMIELMFWLLGASSWGIESRFLAEKAIGLSVSASSMIGAWVIFMRTKDMIYALYFMGIGFGIAGIMIHGYLFIATIFGLITVYTWVLGRMESLSASRTPWIFLFKFFVKKAKEKEASDKV